MSLRWGDQSTWKSRQFKTDADQTSLMEAFRGIRQYSTISMPVRQVSLKAAPWCQTIFPITFRPSWRRDTRTRARNARTHTRTISRKRKCAHVHWLTCTTAPLSKSVENTQSVLMSACRSVVARKVDREALSLTEATKCKGLMGFTAAMHFLMSIKMLIDVNTCDNWHGRHGISGHFHDWTLLS